MPTDPLTASRYPASSAVPNVSQDIQNAVTDLADNTIPDFATTTARDNAYTAWVALGNSMRNGLQCVVNGVPYRRMGGNWRIDGDRSGTRLVTPTGGSIAQNIPSGGAAETGATTGAAALTSITLYEARTLVFRADFRAGTSGTGAAQCTIKVNGAQIGSVPGVTRTDVTCQTGGLVALAAGTHTIALRVDAIGGAITWTNAQVQWWEAIAE